ncbi:MAG: GHKL domain-containing protein [Cyclobacteriaceae bacterium]|nr:GHKL domain-containing protein [Cyclobacteriaceae bacterium]
MEQIFLDSASLLEKIKLPVGLHSVVSPLSIAQLGSFWISILEKSMEENVVLALRYNEAQINFIFSGYLLKDKVLLCGNTELTSTEKALEEIMLINNEQANQIRLTEKKVGTMLDAVRNMEMSETFLNDFSSLNNELINNKRELMRKNQKIELLNEELKVANDNLKMFTRSVTHDLREPVRMVKSFLSLLNKKYVGKLDEKGQIYLNMASDGANRLSQMLEGLLEFHQSEKSSITETVDLNEVLKEVEQMLQKQIELKNAKVNCEKLPILKGSIAGFRQVFQNLISNAIKFVPDGKVPVVSIQVEESASNFTFKVSDNGIGIQENHKQEVFNLFKRLNTAQQYEGTGMGLAMVRKSIERMGGEIWIESTPGEGSTFYFTIPKNELKQKQ